MSFINVFSVYNCVFVCYIDWMNYSNWWNKIIIGFNYGLLICDNFLLFGF